MVCTAQRRVGVSLDLFSLRRLSWIGARSVDADQSSGTGALCKQTRGRVARDCVANLDGCRHNVCPRCHAGHVGAAEPQYFQWAGKRVGVSDNQ